VPVILPLRSIKLSTKVVKFVKVKSEVKGTFICITLYHYTSLKRSNMAVCNKGITQFYLPPTHEPHLHLLHPSALKCTYGTLKTNIHSTYSIQATLWEICVEGCLQSTVFLTSFAKTWKMYRTTLNSL